MRSVSRNKAHTSSNVVAIALHSGEKWTEHNLGQRILSALSENFTPLIIRPISTHSGQKSGEIGLNGIRETWAGQIARSFRH
ncbi:hypothetical protein BN874_480008 [Candidatus Contendobacter odensis Run_B_J11]|uniref:Uncharacterized protein n=1 Tax=Candidatus Contendobacter odensis Run_B_J11 TaxID=1400861 RepID=A0A7U7GDT9_9GAMM|nr:hypothetical protein BN874_480008 [Candidatus Contendobacter odensis Run_B_J11]